MPNWKPVTAISSRQGGAGELLGRLLAVPARRGLVTHVEHVPAREGGDARWPDWVPEPLVGRLRHLGISGLWEHQLATAEHVRRGENVIIATGTASGKSLAYLVPAITEIFAGGTVLYLTPTKALAADQLATIRKLRLTEVRAATYDGDTPPEERSWVRRHANYVLTNPDMLHRSILPRHGSWASFWRRLRLVVVDECHGYRGVFGSHVAQILRRLRRVCAKYGSRPVFLLASATASDPGAAGKRLTGLDMAEVTADASPRGAMTFALWEPPLTELRGERGAPIRRTATAEAADLLTDLVVEGVRTLVFVRSRRGAETVALTAKRHLTELEAVLEAGPYGTALSAGATGTAGPVGSAGAAGSPGPAGSGAASGSGGTTAVGEVGEDPAGAATTPAGSPAVGDHKEAASGDRRGTSARGDGATTADGHGGTTTGRPGDTTTGGPGDTTTGDHGAGPAGGRLADRVAAYRGGYLAEDRRLLEKALRTGELTALATTNALELGVDISGLDAVIIAGWPGTRASLWQQAGRAGRTGQDALVVLIARDDPLDTYIVHHPEAVFGQPVEAIVLDPDNPYVLAPHLCAAAAEIPLTEDDLEIFGPAARDVVDDLVRRGMLRQRPSGWYWTHRERAADLADIRGSGGNPIHVVESGTGRLLGTVDEPSAHTTVHPGAVYLHQGETYEVESLDLEAGVALVSPADPDYATYPRDVTDIRMIESLRSRPFGPGELHFGTVEVTRQVVSYLKRRTQTGEVLGEEPLDLPPRTLCTRAVWWTLPDTALAPLRSAEHGGPVDLGGAAHAAEHASIGLLPLFATCDRWDIGGVSTELHPDTGMLTVFVYDGHDGGAGFAERGFARAADWLTATREAIASCECERGCPSCIQSPKCGNGNEPLDKTGAIRLLDVLLGS
ncbi:DEAD/DEAH box helicase domain protein [Thermobispora bispora DSM 43833]|uniref:DEAD/DEAH box helicase domain protein n=1 Tax=Thermobispora bispora (strain ATCC 19993 / DSM 43833 / CBS 139.67 / JCM 10125 / KCTC 9307 / NBRC 14880 / R51) TaxID=469371 RepID=D6Y2Z1_THEBD|nr:DEAD/DEAH box helicase domain protein [Thermobispora bispora DSM 43833]